MVKWLIISNFIVPQHIKIYDIRTTQPIYGNLQRCYQKFICKGKQNFRKPSLGNTLIVHDNTKKDKFHSNGRYGTHCEQTYRTNFNRGRAKCIDWVKFNLALCRRYLNMDGLLAIAIDPSYISKSGKKTPHIGTFVRLCRFHEAWT